MRFASSVEDVFVNSSAGRGKNAFAHCCWTQPKLGAVASHYSWTGHLVIFIGLNGKAAWVIVAEFFFENVGVRAFFPLWPKVFCSFFTRSGPSASGQRVKKTAPAANYKV
jgi:hypothetical protein